MNIKIREVNESDINFLFKLRNRLETYKVCKNPYPVKEKEHLNWVTPILKKERKDIFLYIILYGREKCGQIRFNTLNEKTVEINISILKEFWGKGIASFAIKKGIKEMNKKGIKKIIAEIKKENKASLNLFKKNNFLKINEEGEYEIFELELKNKIPIEISARHVHLSQEDLEILFGKDYKLTLLKKLSQPNQFASKEKVQLINNEEKLSLRILGPTRENSQAEISVSDSIKLKLALLPPVALSGNLEGAPEILIKGEKGETKIKVIISQRHLHCSEEEAKKLGIKNNQLIKIRISGKRSLIFDNVVARVGKEHKLAFHIDTDEGNASYMENIGKIIGLKK